MKIQENTNTILPIILGLLFFGCSKPSDTAGSATIVVTGNVHSQLDPCG
tara:strand:- start:13349 stop:13495 length:147 start_codon:yes stop_codon:yes gene_type:complete